MLINKSTAIFFCLSLPYWSSSTIAEPFVDIQTSQGLIQVELFPDKAPITVANFLKHVDNKFYDNKLFHRVIDHFMIQAGSPNTDLPQQKPIDHTSITLEHTQKTTLSNQRGSIAMARKASPNSAIAQFFINTVDNNFLDYTGRQTPGYAVFGQVTGGMDIVDNISQVKTNTRDVPKEPITVESIRRHQDKAIETLKEENKPNDIKGETKTISSDEDRITTHQLLFDPVQKNYITGETVTIKLNEIDPQRKDAFDLWIGIQTPNLPEGQLLYFSEKDELTRTASIFKLAVKADDNTYHAMDFLVPKGMTGRYTFYAIFNKPNHDLSHLDDSLRSNIATIDVILGEPTESTAD